MKLKITLLILSFFYFFAFNAQQLKVGAVVGSSVIDKNILDVYTTGLSFEYRPSKSFLSINTELNGVFSKNFGTFSQPIYAKLLFGEKVKIGPSLGVFYRLSKQYGAMAGFNLDVQLSDKYLLFTKLDLYFENERYTFSDHFGGSHVGSNHFKSFWINIGLKKSFSFAKEKQ